MGIEAEIDNKENFPILSNLKDDITCPICFSILQDPMMLDCCGGHLCFSCLEDIRKSFNDCALCRKSGYTAIKSRFMMSFLSQIKLICPATACKAAIPYAEFEEHKQACLERCLGFQKMSLGPSNKEMNKSETSMRAEKRAQCYSQNAALKKELKESKMKIEESKMKIEAQKKQIGTLEAKICCHKEKTAAMETNYKGQLKDARNKNETLKEQYSTLKKEYKEYKKDMEYGSELDDKYLENLTTSLSKFKKANETLHEENMKCRAFLAKILREKHAGEIKEKIMQSKEAGSATEWEMSLVEIEECGCCHFGPVVAKGKIEPKKK